MTAVHQAGAAKVAPIEKRRLLNVSKQNKAQKKVSAEQRAEWGKKLAVIRQNKYDPGSPCMECRQDACPAVCKRKHTFEIGRRLRE